VGRVLNAVTVSRRDPTGRAELISLEGERRRQLRGWEFKIIVGRALGWSVLKSSRFEVSRRGESFFFRGSGFGHGLGLCQQGAHVMARRGMSCRQILDHYFPGTKIGEENVASAESKIETPGPTATSEATLQSSGHASLRSGQARLVRLSANDSLWLARADREVPFERESLISYSPSVPREGHRGWSVRNAVILHALPVKPQATMRLRPLTLSSEHFRVDYPANLSRQDVEEVMRTLESARADVLRRLARASLSLPERSVHAVILHASTQDFTAATGQPWWSAGATRGSKSEFQPVAVLRRRGVLASTLRHEYAHAVIEALGGGRTARWLAEGLAIHVAGEGGALEHGMAKTRQTRQSRLSIQDLERSLEHPRSVDEMRSLYAAAHSEVLEMIRKEGEAGVWRRVSEGK